MRDQASRIKRNSLFAFLSHFFRMLTNVVLFISIARSYGPEEFGQFTAAHTLATVFLFLADFGFDTLLASEVARDRKNAFVLVRRLFSLKLAFALAASLLMILTALVQGVSAPTRLLMMVFSSFVFLSALMNFFFALFKGVEEMQYETWISFAANLLLLCVVLALGYAGASLLVIAIAFTASRVIGLMLTWHTARRQGFAVPISFSFSGRSDLGIVLVFGLQALFGNLFFVQDTLLLSAWSGDYQVGIYQSVFKLISVVLVVQEVVVVALLPALSRLYLENREGWSKYGGLASRTLLFIALPIALAFVIYADRIVTLIYGATDYNEAIPILRIFGLIVLIRFSVEAYALMLTTSQRQKRRLWVVAGATVFNLLLNWYAIPRWGPLGAAVVSLTTNLLVGVGYVAATGRLFYDWFLNIRPLVPLMCAVAIGVALWNLYWVSPLVTAPLALLFLSAIILWFGFTQEERHLVFARGGFGLRGRIDG